MSTAGNGKGFNPPGAEPLQPSTPEPAPTGKPSGRPRRPFSGKDRQATADFAKATRDMTDTLAGGHKANADQIAGLRADFDRFVNFRNNGAPLRAALELAGITPEKLREAGYHYPVVNDANLATFLAATVVRHESHIRVILKTLGLKEDENGELSRDATVLEKATERAAAGGGKNTFVRALREDGWDDLKIHDALGTLSQEYPNIATDGDGKIFVLFLADYRSFKYEVRQAFKDLNDRMDKSQADSDRNTTGLFETNEVLNVVKQDVKDVKENFATFEKTAIETRDGGNFPWLGLVVALLLGLLTWWLLVDKVYHATCQATTENSDVTASCAAGFNNPVIALIAGIIVFIVVVVIVTLLPASARSKMTIKRKAKAAKTAATATQPAPKPAPQQVPLAQHFDSSATPNNDGHTVKMPKVNA